MTNVWYVVFSLTVNYDGTNVTYWSEDDWLETRFFIDKQFMFNHERFNHLILRTRMDEWSLELSFGNDTRFNHLWTELHMYLDRSQSRSILNGSEHISVKSFCRSPIVSPLTNDSTVQVPELSQMDQRIAEYFTNDGFFRTINYIHCTIHERRRTPTFRIEMDIYLVTNREFQSLLYLRMPTETRQFLFKHHARFYLHNHQPTFRYNMNISSSDEEAPLVRMIKLYRQPAPPSFGIRTVHNKRTTTIFFILLSFFYFSSKEHL